MTEAQIVEGWLEGLVTDEAYVWREGLDDWTPIADVPELVNEINRRIDEAEASEAEVPEPVPAPAVVPKPAWAPAPSASAVPTPAALHNPAARSPAGLSPGNSKPAMATAKALAASPQPTALRHSGEPAFFPSIEETKPYCSPSTPSRRMSRATEQWSLNAFLKRC
jgi:hypothetical protein